MEHVENRGETVPGFTAELGTRIAELYRLVGGQAVAAEIVESTSETLGKWKRGRARMPLHAAVTLCNAAGKSLDWLTTGEIREPVSGLAEGQAPFGDGVVPLDEELMLACIEMGLEWAEGSGKSPEEVARRILKGYRRARAVGKHPSDTHEGKKTG